MIIDSVKMKSARDRRALTQEQLAHQARVNVRTVQRAENGEAIRHETLADIAAVLGMPPAGLIVSEPMQETEDDLDNVAAPMQVLKRVDRADIVITTLERAVMASVDCNADPTDHNMPSLRAIIKALESNIGNPWEETNCLPLRFSSLLDKLEITASLNNTLRDLERVGLALYCAASTEYVKVPHMHDEGLAINYRQKPEYVTAVRFLIANYDSERIRVSSDVLWPLKIEPEPAHLFLDTSDDVPF